MATRKQQAYFDEVRRQEEFHKQFCGKMTFGASAAYAQLPGAKARYEKALAYYNLNPSSWSSKRAMERAKAHYEKVQHEWDISY